MNMDPSELLNRGTVERLTPSDPKVRHLHPPGPFKIDIQWATGLKAPVGGDYLIKGVLEPASTSIWFGPAGNGKTFLILSMLYSVAMGHEFFGRKVRPGKTLYVALEGRGGIDKRVYALAKHMGECADFGTSGDMLQLLENERHGAKINTAHVDALVAVIRENGIKVVIIDTLNLVIGGADENDNSAMGLLMAAAGDIAKATGAHVGFIAHSAKAGTDGGPRGGGAQKGNADLVVAISGEDVFTASSFAPGGKNKDGAAFKLHFALKGVELGTDSDGDPITSCVIEEADGAEAKTGPKLTPTEATWLKDLQELFARPGKTHKATPEAGMGEISVATRTTVRGWARERGLIGVADSVAGVATDQPLSATDRSTFNRMLGYLKSKGVIQIHGEYIWLTGHGQ